MTEQPVRPAIGTLHDVMMSVPKSTHGNSSWAEAYGREQKRLLIEYAARAPRTLQKHLGPSELGEPCDRQVIGKMAGVKSTNHVSDPWASVMGTAGHAYVEEMYSWDNSRRLVLNGVPRWIPEQRVTPDPDVTSYPQPGPESHPGTADLYDMQWMALVDHKFLGDSSRQKLIAAGKPKRTYYVQLLLYRRGYQHLGLRVDRVVLLAWPRTKSSLDELYVWEHVPTEEDERLVDEVLQQTMQRQEVAKLVREGTVSISDIPVTPSDDSCHWCFEGNTEVVTRDGVKRIADLAGTVPELLVPTVNHGTRMRTGVFQPHPVKYFGYQELYRVTLEDRRARKEVLATREHSWFTTTRLRSGRRTPNSEQRVMTTDLNPGDLLVPLRRARTTEPDRMDVAVAQGFMFGDGTKGQGERPATLTVYDNGKDAAMLKFFPFVTFKPAEFPQQNGGSALVAYGLPRSWKELPDIRESRAFLLSWLAGYFAADGTVSKGGACSIASSSRTHIRFIRDVAAVCGVGYRPYSKRMRKGVLGHETALYEITLQRRDLPSWFFLIEEHQRQVTAFNSRPERESYWKVVSVEATGIVEPVYCATVKDVEAFGLADDLMTGNCPQYRPQAAYDRTHGCPGTLLKAQASLPKAA